MKKVVNLEAFVTTNECSCHYAFFTEKIFRVIAPQKDVVNLQIKGITSPDGVKYGIKDLALVVNKEKTLPASFKEEELLDLVLPCL
jgi:hypothetical protein